MVTTGKEETETLLYFIYQADEQAKKNCCMNLLQDNIYDLFTHSFCWEYFWI